MHKFTKFLLILVLVLLIIYIFLNNYTFEMEHEDMQSKVGNIGTVGGIELTFTDYYTLKQSFDTYADFIASGDYETAYSMLGTSYKNYVPYEDYKNKIKDVKEMLQVHDINFITNTTFDLLVGGKSGDEEEHYSLIINKEKNTFALYPESFLDYNSNEIKLSKNKVQYILKNYIVNIDECIFNFEITNNNKKALTISKCNLITNGGEEYNNSDVIEIPSKETKEVSIKFDTNYQFPKKITFENNIKNVEMSFN